LHYLSPEIIQGGKYSFSSDVWSLGVIVYELMMNTKPFDDKIPNQLMTKICSEEPVYLSNYSIKIQNIVKLMLLKDPFSESL
jgi:serine/threonine protein kinase